ncbi:hypothetical protein Pcinc_031502 [Petrolisthes cinctipes]|uniref:Uncharacterized protein n=1 Tax=Petrolisthes cinctipes TaxID=88211 RepID=A0AAE1EWJ0_PETCI|nr:hypothetical protein Pcinc_031502 [Petrolisthes cinctipes]
MIEPPAEKRHNITRFPLTGLPYRPTLYEVRGPRALRGQVEELPGAVSPATTTTDSSSRHFTVSSNS